jgi:methoxymalonate biosynthesis acyl carrier protein
MQLVLFVEKEFGIQVDNEDLELSNFESVNALTRLVMAKRRQ